MTVVSFSLLLSLRSLAGITGPLFGALADRWGRRRVMTAALIGQSLGMIGLDLSQSWWAALPMILLGFIPTAFTPAGHAYISDQIPYEKRGRAIGTIEFAWAIAGIAGLPLVGLLIDTFGWRAPLLCFSLISLIGAVFIRFRLPPAVRHEQPRLSLGDMGRVFLKPGVLGAVGVAMMLAVSVGGFATLWGIWLSADFGLEATALGLVATGIGLAEWAGSGFSSVFIDRIGKRAGSQAGLLLIALTWPALLLTRASLPAVILVLLVISLCLEYSIVSLIPLYSEQAPAARATVFSLVALGFSFGLTICVPLTATLWQRVGLWPICLMGAAAALLGLVIFRRFLP
jgi:predicted MFS family arabinose efflux permease